MHVVTTAEMVEAERLAVMARVPEMSLMESAGKSVADTAQDMLPPGGTVTIMCGPGKNGGDGFVAARYLINRGFCAVICWWNRTCQRLEVQGPVSEFGPQRW